MTEIKFKLIVFWLPFKTWYFLFLIFIWFVSQHLILLLKLSLEEYYSGLKIVSFDLRYFCCFQLILWSYSWQFCLVFGWPSFLHLWYLILQRTVFTWWFFQLTYLSVFGVYQLMQSFNFLHGQSFFWLKLNNLSLVLVAAFSINPELLVFSSQPFKLRVDLKRLPLSLISGHPILIWLLFDLTVQYQYLLTECLNLTFKDIDMIPINLRSFSALTLFIFHHPWYLFFFYLQLIA